MNYTFMEIFIVLVLVWALFSDGQLLNTLRLAPNQSWQRLISIWWVISMIAFSAFLLLGVIAHFHYMRTILPERFLIMVLLWGVMRDIYALNYLRTHQQQTWGYILSVVANGIFCALSAILIIINVFYHVH